MPLNSHGVHREKETEARVDSALWHMSLTMVFERTFQTYCQRSISEMLASYIRQLTEQTL